MTQRVKAYSVVQGLLSLRAYRYARLGQPWFENWIRREFRLGQPGDKGGEKRHVATSTHVYAQDYTSARLQEHVSFLRLLFCVVHVFVISVGCRQSNINIL